MVHPFVPTFLLVWALSLVPRACTVPSATQAPERQGARSEAAPVKEARPVGVSGAIPG
jgi:hypothetical protein